MPVCAMPTEEATDSLDICMAIVRSCLRMQLLFKVNAHMPSYMHCMIHMHSACMQGTKFLHLSMGTKLFFFSIRREPMLSGFL